MNKSLYSYIFRSDETRRACADSVITKHSSQPPQRCGMLRLLRPALVALGSLVALQMGGIALAQTESALSAAQKASVLRTKEAELHARLQHNAYGRPLWLQSSETSSLVSGHAYAVLDAPFDTVDAAFRQPARWCDVLMLHLNTKYCRASFDASPALLKVNVGKKTAQDLADTFPLEFTLFPQTLVNVRLAPGQDWRASKPLADATAAAEAELGGAGRVLIRASGTEPLLRVMVEAPDAGQAQRLAETIARTVRAPQAAVEATRCKAAA